jgi:tetratricopeptide (TPR) repeat protein
MDRYEQFYHMCTTLPLPEEKDERGENSVPELAKVAELRDSGNVRHAIEYAEGLMKLYPDHDLIPFMIAYMYYQKELPEEAHQVATEAMEKCPRKYRLYSVAGLAEFARGRLPEALVWWSRSVVAQCQMVDFQEYDPFLHLAHAALAIGAKREAASFFEISDAIARDTLRLSPANEARLAPIAGSWYVESLRRALQEINTKYLREASGE